MGTKTKRRKGDTVKAREVSEKQEGAESDK